MFLVVDSIRHAYADKLTFDCLSFNLERYQLGCLLGPSGSGKSTILACLAGLEHISHGTIELAGKQLAGRGYHCLPEQRRISMVFQESALYPHMTVERNLLFQVHRWSKQAQYKRKEHITDLCNLQSLLKAYPHELSGGEQRRVSLACGLMADFDLILLDEPFTGLDSQTRNQLAGMLRDIVTHERLSALVVTHDKYEAFMIGQVGGILNQGLLCQWSDMEGLYRRPQNAVVANFMGEGTVIRGFIRKAQYLQFDFGRLNFGVDIRSPMLQNNDVVDVLLRPDQLQFEFVAERAQAQGKIIEKSFKGPMMIYKTQMLDSQGIECEQLLIASTEYFNLALGQLVNINVKPYVPMMFPSI